MLNELWPPPHAAAISRWKWMSYVCRFYTTKSQNVKLFSQKKKWKKTKINLAVSPDLCYPTDMKDKESQIAELSRQYWEALENLDFAWADFCDSALEMMGANPLPKE